MITANGVSKVLFGLAIIATVGYIGNKIKDSVDTNEKDEYDLIKKYLLNDSPLYGYNRPKLWIHTKYELNARKWKDFYSRNSTDLNQPYIHLCIRSIINHCSNDFNICLIDDETFSKLLPNWDINLPTVADPMKSQMREYGLAQLLYYYGGIIVPNSFLCSRNLLGLYSSGISDMKPFACERVNHTLNNTDPQQKYFLPDTYFMGAEKNDNTMKELVEYLRKKNLYPHFTAEPNFKGNTAHWLLGAVKLGKMNLIGGEEIGIKTRKRKPVLIEDLLGEGFLDIDKEYGIYIPEDEILSRTKYQWFPVMTTDQILATNTIIAKYIKASMVDYSSEYSKKSTIESILSI